MFIENRGKTAFWNKLAKALEDKGHEIFWIVQNPVYGWSNLVGKKFGLLLPKGKDLFDQAPPEILSTDRGRVYFEAGSRHYEHYTRMIDRALDQLSPDVVIGEPTLFHELLAIASCRKREIPYYHPTMARYPAGRFMLFDSDTQNPVITSNDCWKEDELEALAKAISNGQSLPSYMTALSSLERREQKIRRPIGHARNTLGRLMGERYNTPSPKLKIALSRSLKENLAAWAELAQKPSFSSGPLILYPLQMQPEANIDVWGRPFSNQIDFIKQLLSGLPPEGRVAVKANPKSKYEVSTELVSFARQQKRVVLLPIGCKMDSAQSWCDGTVTVSGTVGLEAVFGRGRCLSLRHPVLQKYFPNFHADTPQQAVELILANDDFGRGDLATGKALLKQLVMDSFEGIVNEPMYDQRCMERDNVAKVSNALEAAISSHIGGEAA